MLFLFCKLSTNNFSPDHTNYLSIIDGQKTETKNRNFCTVWIAIERKINKVSNSIDVIIILKAFD